MWGAGSESFLRAPVLCATEMSLCQFQVGQVEAVNQQGLGTNHIHRSGTQNLGHGPSSKHWALMTPQSCRLENPPQVAFHACPTPPQASGYCLLHSSSLFYYICSIWRRPAKKGGKTKKSLFHFNIGHRKVLWYVFGWRFFVKYIVICMLFCFFLVTLSILTKTFFALIRQYGLCSYGDF